VALRHDTLEAELADRCEESAPVLVVFFALLVALGGWASGVGAAIVILLVFGIPFGLLSGGLN